MRIFLLGGLALLLAACSSKPGDTAHLTLNNPVWDRVNVEIVITKRADCDSREEGFIDSKQLVMRKNGVEVIDIPNGATLCWRRDRNPSSPSAGVWTGWTRASMPPGQSADTNL